MTATQQTVWVQATKWLTPEWPGELECQTPNDLSLLLGYPVDSIEEYDNINRREGLERDKDREAELAGNITRSQGEIRVWVDAEGNETTECVFVDAPKGHEIGEDL